MIPTIYFKWKLSLPHKLIRAQILLVTLSQILTNILSKTTPPSVLKRVLPKNVSLEEVDLMDFSL